MHGQRQVIQLIFLLYLTNSIIVTNFEDDANKLNPKKIIVKKRYDLLLCTKDTIDYKTKSIVIFAFGLSIVEI